MITYPPELLPLADEGQAADVIICANHPNCPVANAEITRLTARIEELEKALKPFVEYAQQYRQSTLDIICSGPDGCVITRDDLRFARSTLEASNKGGKS